MESRPETADVLEKVVKPHAICYNTERSNKPDSMVTKRLCL